VKQIDYMRNGRLLFRRQKTRYFIHTLSICSKGKVAYLFGNFQSFIEVLILICFFDLFLITGSDLQVLCISLFTVSLLFLVLCDQTTGQFLFYVSTFYMLALFDFISNLNLASVSLNTWHCFSSL